MSVRPAPAGACGRADLLRALAQGGAPLLGSTASLLGYVETPAEHWGTAYLSLRAEGASSRLDSVSPTPQVAEHPLADARFWRLEAYEALPTRGPEPEPEPAAGPLGWTHRPATPPVMQPLAAWPDLRRRLHPHLTAPRDGPEPDLGRLVARLGRGLLLGRLPRLQQRRLGPDLHLIFDRSEHLVPYWGDQDQVAGDLARLLPAGALTRGVFHEGLSTPRLLDRPDGRYRPPPQGGLVLVLGDLGSLALGAPAAPWLRLGRRLAAAGCRAVALVPCRPGRVPGDLRRLWDLVQWERPVGLGGGAPWDDSAAARGAGTRRLLSLLAPAVRIEPGFLRAVRLSLADPALEAAAESDLWQDGAVAGTHSEAATLNPRALAELRAAFAAQPLPVQARVLDLLRTWRARLPPELWFEEVLNLAPATQAALPQPRDLADARRFFAAVCADLGADLSPDPQAPAPAGDWVRRVMTRATGIWADAQVGRPLVRLDWTLHRHRPNYRPPVPIAPADLPAGDQAVRRVAVSQQGADLIFAPSDAPPCVRASPLAILETRNRLISIGPPEPGLDGDRTASCERPPGRDASQPDANPPGTATHVPNGAAPRPPPGGADLLSLDGSGAASRALPLLPAIQILSDRERLTLHQIARPAWASAIGRDRFGLWAEVAVAPRAAAPAPQGRRWWSRKSTPKADPQPAPEPVIQRLRWVPPGRFLMGSPVGEPGRWDVEGPQHQVSIGRGYWLFDTPCTQALWAAVMDENPSRFKSPDRPVEQVNWDAVQGFIARINGLIPGLALALPTEAQWEHACRAGTQTALYSGPIAILGRNNAPALDPIAWYGGNSGVDYDLDDAWETVGDLWQEMQYETKRAGTRRVKGKAPNPWGLYDMLGNVWEWVADSWHDNYQGAPEDGTLWDYPNAGAARVVRGGSWGDGARDCRCAYRVRVAPDVRDDGLGFRCARVQES